MIDAKSFMEFFEKECNVKFIDVKTGTSALEVIAEQEMKRKSPNKDPVRKSDYDLSLESDEDYEIISDNEEIPDREDKMSDDSKFECSPEILEFARQQKREINDELRYQALRPNYKRNN